MSLTDPQRSELLGLANAAADGRLAPQAQARLEQCLESSADARQDFIRFMTLSAGLAAIAQQAVPESTAPAQGSTAPIRRIRWTLAAAACLLLTAAIVLGFLLARTPRSTPGSAGVAVLAETQDAYWANAVEPAHIGAMLKPGWIRLRSGTARIVFLNGTSVHLLGPAEFQLVTPTEGYLASGRLTADIGKPPFRVQSPSVTVTDNGTSFGMDLTVPGTTIVHVFEGQVEIARAATAPQSLAEGQALAIGPFGERRFPTSRQEFDSRGGALPDRPPFGPGFGPRDGGPLHGGAWQGPPTDGILDRLGADPERRKILEPLLRRVLDARNAVRGDGDPWSDPVTKSRMDLFWALRDDQSPEDQIRADLDALHQARATARAALDEARAVLREKLTPREEAALLTMGIIN